MHHEKCCNNNEEFIIDIKLKSRGSSRTVQFGTTADTETKKDTDKDK